jgi:glycosyltransferase involved in cell wall biosynthesis
MGGGEKILAVMAEHFSRNNEVIVLVTHPVDTKSVGSYFDVNLENIKFEQIRADSMFLRMIMSSRVKFPARWKSLIHDRDSLKVLRKLNASLFINIAYQSNLPSPASQSIYVCMFPQKLTPTGDQFSFTRRVYGKLTDILELKLLGSRNSAIDSYTVVAAISDYTAGWISQYWSREAEILYPVCDDMGPPAEKKNVILSVGRFFADNGSSHHKRHDELIAAFISLGRSDWELHLVGSLARDSDSQAYFSKLASLAENHKNIFIHHDMPFSGLKKLRRESSIYWHATGLGYNAESSPESQEHFGIATVEAMSAGSVPVVYNSAGQKEIVRDGQNGFLWDTIDELLVKTSRLIDDRAVRDRLALAAAKRAKEFNRGAFIQRLDSMVNTLIH